MRRAYRRLPRANQLSAVVLCLSLIGLAWPGAAMAQAFNHPFAVGGDEGPTGPVSGLTAWLMAQESSFSFMLTHALRESRENHAALLLLAGLSFAYGVVHAAGPGHGKAVITSYLISNERALKRGLVIALLAALLQGFVAIALVGSAAGIFHVTAQYMNAAARDIDLAAYAGIVLLGLVLLTTKSAALARSLRQTWNVPVLRLFAAPRSRLVTSPQLQEAEQVFLADDGSDHVHGRNCGHVHAPDPRQLGEGFSWKSAATTIGTAGARPCSGAILILVFSLAQNIFLVGVTAVFAMALGTALTTGCLATLAVFAKKTALRMSSAVSHRAEIIGRVIEVGAAFCVLLFGATLLYATVVGLTPAA